MARRDSQTRHTSPITIDSDILEHIRGLGLRDVEEYQTWCAQNGFSKRLRKHWRMRLRERTHAIRVRSDDRLAQKKAELRRPAETIARIFRGEVSKDAVTQPFLAVIVRAYQIATRCPARSRGLLRILLEAAKHPDLLSAEPVIRNRGVQEGNSYVEALIAMARPSDRWIRPPETWKPRTHNTHRKFTSLARHLFARWPIPPFMNSAWFKGNSAAGLRQQGWFLHLARGKNLRTADLPIPYTKRMAHYFMQAPDDFTIEAALRLGQIRALGGTEQLAKAVVATQLGQGFDNDDFWLTVLRWFCANPLLDMQYVGPIVDFIQHQRFAAERVVNADGAVVRGEPAQPKFCMKGRTPAALLRQVDAWHRQLAKTAQPAAEWAHMDIADFQFVEGTSTETIKTWTIRELLSSKALQTEGRTMRHCVGGYVRSCAAGSSSIWTMEVESAEGKRKVLTIELRKSARLIIQARGKWNALPTDKQRGILRRWAAASGLRLSTYV
jgi:hypothetical protein